MVVHFKNLADANSIEDVDPAQDGTYSLPGVHIVKAIVELTDEAVSTVPASWPRWLVEQDFKLLDVKHNIPGGSPYVGYWSFRGL